MFGFGLGGKVALGLGIVLLLGAGAFAWYFNYSQDEIKSQAKEIAALEGANAALETTIEKMNEHLSNQIEGLDKLNKEVANIRKETGELGKVLAEHDLRYLSAQKPGLIENRVNAGTKRLFSNLENITDPSTYTTKKEEEDEKDD